MDPMSMGALYGGSALASGLSGMLGHRGKFKQMPTMTPQQIQQSNWAGQTGMNQIQNPYEGFQPIADRAQRMYQQQTVPGLMERFNAMGSGNALSSGALLAQLRGSGIDLSGDLAALESQYGLQQQQLGQHLLGMGQNQQFENQYMPGGHSWLSSLFGGASQGMGGMAGYGQQSNMLKQLLQSLSQQNG